MSAPSGTDLEQEVMRFRKQNRILREEEGYLKKGQPIFCEAKMKRIAFIEQHGGVVPTERLCHMLGVTSRGFRV